MGDIAKLVWSDEPLGYTKATNLGIKQATGEYVILLNNDTELLPQPSDTWLQMLEQPFIDEPNVGLTGPLELYDRYAASNVLIFFCVMIKRDLFAKIGLSITHLATFLKEFGFIEKLIEKAKDIGEIDPTSSEAKKIMEMIPNFNPILAYINGFVWKDDFDKNSFQMKVRTRNKQKIRQFTSGIGKFPPDNQNTYELVGIGTPGGGQHYFASSGELRWNSEDWKKLVKNL